MLGEEGGCHKYRLCSYKPAPFPFHLIPATILIQEQARSCSLTRMQRKLVAMQWKTRSGRYSRSQRVGEGERVSLKVPVLFVVWLVRG